MTTRPLASVVGGVVTAAIRSAYGALEQTVVRERDLNRRGGQVGEVVLNGGVLGQDDFEPRKLVAVGAEDRRADPLHGADDLAVVGLVGGQQRERIEPRPVGLRRGRPGRLRGRENAEDDRAGPDRYRLVLRR